MVDVRLYVSRESSSRSKSPSDWVNQQECLSNSSNQRFTVSGFPSFSVLSTADKFRLLQSLPFTGDGPPVMIRG